jgi:hypothetical protein
LWNRAIWCPEDQIEKCDVTGAIVHRRHVTSRSRGQS